MDYDFCKHILLFCVLSVSGVSKEVCQKEVWRENKQMYEYDTVYCAYYEIINGTCIDFIRPFQSFADSTADSLRRTLTNHCIDDCYRDDIDYVRMIGSICILLILLLLLSLVIFCLTCICWKYELSCKKRERRSVHTILTHPNESGNNPPQGETHQYDEVDDGFLNRESSVNDGHDVRNSGSTTGGSGICGVDGDGYLNPYHALNAIEITIGQRASSEQSSRGTSYVQAQENTVYFQTSE